MTLVPQGLKRQRVASILLAIAFLAMELVWALLFSFLMVLTFRWRLEGSAMWAAGVGLALLANTWGLARSVKNGHFLWLYSRWTTEDGGGERALDQLHLQARQAFADGDLERVLLLTGKLDPGARPPDLSAGLGRSLALLGRLEEAATAFRQHGRDAECLRWLQPRRAWGLDWPVYFVPADARWARRHLWLVLLAACSMLGGLVAVERSVALARSQRGEAFDRQGFQSVQRGPFTLYYHDPAFMEQSAELLEKALAHQLAFFRRQGAALPAGAMRVYLCETREEYLQRAPYAPAWEQASALPALDSIYIHKLPDDERIYFESVLAHELSHLLYHRFYPVHGNDAWLNEGVADHLGYAFALDRAGFARQEWLNRHRFQSLSAQALPFDRFFAIDPHSLARTEDVQTFYRQGFSLVFMLIEHYGEESFLRFMDAYRRSDGQVTRALAEAYPSIRSTEDLAAVWGLFYGKGR